MSDPANQPGYKTSEFWVTVVIGAFVFLNQSGILGSFKIPTDSLGDIVTLAVSFILGRLGLKGVATVATKNAEAKVEAAKAKAEGAAAANSGTADKSTGA